MTEIDSNSIEAAPIEIAVESLSAEALLGVIDDFILREGTEYGLNDVSYEAKVQQVRRQLDAGTAIITFDPQTESVTLIRTK